MATIYLLLGGNIGDKKKIFSDALARISELVGKITARSAIYETEPWGFESSDLFWNQALEVSTSLSPKEVLCQVQQIELELGRTRESTRYNSRILDIDILFYGNQIINLENLIIPHPRIQERKFALVPLCEIAPDWIHPVFQKKMGQLLDECRDSLRVEKIQNALD